MTQLAAVVTVAPAQAVNNVLSCKWIVVSWTVAVEHSPVFMVHMTQFPHQTHGFLSEFNRVGDHDKTHNASTVVCKPPKDESRGCISLETKFALPADCNTIAMIVFPYFNT